MNLSVIIITKNEEELISDCIKSISFADEVIVIDSESTDKTVDIARKLGAQIVTKKFTNYADQRATALKHAKGKWLLYIDADERASEKLHEEIVEVVNRKPQTANGTDSIVAFRIPRQNYYLGKNKWPHIEYLERLFLKEKLVGWESAVHEHAIYTGEVGTLQNPIIHYTHRNLELMTAKTNQWSEVEADMLLASHHPLMNELRFIRIMLTKFFDSYIKQGGWKIGTPGLIESLYQAYSYFIIYAKLWEKQNKLRVKK